MPTYEPATWALAGQARDLPSPGPRSSAGCGVKMCLAGPDGVTPGAGPPPHRSRVRLQGIHRPLGPSGPLVVQAERDDRAGRQDQRCEHPESTTRTRCSSRLAPQTRSGRSAPTAGPRSQLGSTDTALAPALATPRSGRAMCGSRSSPLFGPTLTRCRRRSGIRRCDFSPSPRPVKRRVLPGTSRSARTSGRIDIPASRAAASRQPPPQPGTSSLPPGGGPSTTRPVRPPSDE